MEHVDAHIADKLLRYTSHADFLDSCIKESVIPEGFKWNWEVQVEVDENTRARINNVKRNASLQLMKLTTDACRRKVSEIEQEKHTKYCDEAARFPQKQHVLAQHKESKFHKLKQLNVNIKDETTSIRDFVTIKTTADGNCFYRCISNELYTTENKHILVRDRVVKHLKECNDYSRFVDGDYEKHIQDQEHFDGRLESWATEAEIYAAATVFKARIQIFQKTNQGYSKLNFEPMSNVKVKQHIFLKLENEHFDLLHAKHKTTHEREDTHSNTGIFDWFSMSFVPSKYVNIDIPHENAIETSQPMTRNTHKKALHKSMGKNDTDKERKKEAQLNDAIVTNLSSKSLSASEISLLSKGLSFVPTEKRIDITKVKSDLVEWERRMRLKEYFHDKEDEGEQDLNETRVWSKKESTFTPLPGRDKHLDEYIEDVKTDVIKGIKNHTDPNLSKTERNAMDSLLQDSSIVIRPADKGSGIVIINTDDYIKNLNKELENGDTYERTNGMCHEKAIKTVKKISNKLARDEKITPDLHKYLIPDYPESGKLNGNPKVHKEGNPLRTIINGIGTPTERMAEVAEKELDFFVTNTPSYIRDTNDFLNKLNEIKTPLPENTILFCFDVIKLYPSIPREEGLQACKEALAERPNTQIPADAILKMITTVLDNNIFRFNGEEFSQKGGVAIGSKLGKNFACAYMRTWDRSLESATKRPLFYKRFIDDGFGIWEHGEEELLQFQVYANSIHPSIKLTLRWSYTSVEFLDTIVSIQDGFIVTDLYTKPTDKHLYVQQKSAHPTNVKSAIPYGLALRIKRICSNEKDYFKHRDNLKSQLRRRGYSGKFVEKSLRRVDGLQRHELLKNKSKNSQKKTTRVPLVVTYSNRLPNIGTIISKHKDKLYKSTRMQEVFNELPLVAYRRGRNLADTLVHGKTNKVLKEKEVDPNVKCNQNCVVCDMLVVGSAFMKSRNMKVAKEQKCTAYNLVYGISCASCRKIVYVGETSRSLKERLKEHEADVRLCRDRAVSHHFNNNDHNTKDMGVLILEKIYDKSRIYRRTRELQWIEDLETESPNGLNTKAKLGVLWTEFK